MKAFQPYVDHLQSVIATVRDAGQTATDADAVSHALDGGAPDALRRLVALNLRREVGAFFTSSDLARTAWQPLLGSLTSKSVIADPACGAGSLLIPGLQALLQLTRDRDACRQVRGLDISESFVAAARARLLLAVLTINSPIPDPLPEIKDLNGIQPGDALKDMRALLENVTHVVLNPPYNVTSAPPGCNWATGTVNNAAVFLEICLRSMPSGSHVSAILPDVLRSGTRYPRWRKQIEKLAEVKEIIPWGLFDGQTDVHVFVVHLIKRNDVPSVDIDSLTGNIFSVDSHPSPTSTVSTFFEVTVGAVVPHRHAEVGAMRPFATARLLPAWETVSEVNLKRQFSGRCEKPPFVVVRRTSRPGQNPRASATIIAGNDDVAVDNHLLIARPRDGSLDSCRKLLAVLQQETATHWLDHRYQCRHLAVEAIANLPWTSQERSL